MAKPLLRRCPACGRYTLRRGCPECGGDTRSAHPARYSPDDKYARYRLAERYAAGGGTGGGGGEREAANAPAVPGP